MRKWLSVLALGVVLTCGPVTLAADVELPAAAKKAFTEKYKDATNVKVKPKVVDQKTFYEIEFKNAARIEYEIEMTADGAIESEGHGVKPEDLPKAVTDLVTKDYLQANIKEAKIETEKGVTTYEVELKTKDGNLEVEIAGDGSKIIKAVKDDDDDDDDDDDGGKED